MTDNMCPYPDGQVSYPTGPNKNRYTPLIQPGQLPDMPATETVTWSSTVQLRWPYTSPTSTVILRTPELNDIFLFQAYRVQRYSRGDTLIVYRDPTWFKSRVYNWSFTGLTRQNRDDILDFVKLSAGDYVEVTDYWSRVFKAIIINPDNPITQELPDYAQSPPSAKNGMGYTWKVDLQKALV